jgi:hypothetical protein
MPATQGRKNACCIVVADFLSCYHVRVCACMWVQRVVIADTVTFPAYDLVIGGGGVVCVR